MSELIDDSVTEEMPSQGMQQSSREFAKTKDSNLTSSAQRSLFKHGSFTSHSGIQLPDKVDCDALTKADWDAVAAWFAARLTFGNVVGIPSGGLPLAKALKNYVTTGPTLIADDVLTTGRSMEEARREHPGAIGAVLFSRTANTPNWITARWMESDLTQPDTGQPDDCGREFRKWWNKTKSSDVSAPLAWQAAWHDQQKIIDRLRETIHNIGVCAKTNMGSPSHRLEHIEEVAREALASE